jgi:fatty acid desaturase
MKAVRAQEQQIMEKPSFGELIGRLATESSQLVRDEIALAKQELSEKVTRSADSGKFIAAGAVLGLLAVFSFCAFLILALAIWLPAWLSALLVTAAFGAAAFFTINAGIAKWQSVNKNLEQTMETLEEDKRWIKQLDLTK